MKFWYYIDKALHGMLKAIYRLLHSRKIINLAKKVDCFLMKHTGQLYDITIRKMKKYVKYHSADMNKSNYGSLEWQYDKKLDNTEPKVSVIVPNYNHARFLKERLDSIYNQTYTNYEVILLDDCSSDNSRDILKKYAEEHDNTRCIFNEKNGGKVFLQWEKGIEEATGELIWIAESDDYCDNDFLEKMVELFRYESTMLAFSRSDFVQDGKRIWTIEEYLCDIAEIDWNKNFTMSAYDITRIAFSRKNIIPNVSSAVFRNVHQVSTIVKEYWERFKLSGDWIFYLELIRGGCISYTVETTNYYRVHKESTSLNVQKTEAYYREYYDVSQYIAQNYKVENGIWEKNLEFLKEKAKLDGTDVNVEAIYSCEKLNHIRRNMNIIMGVFAMASGGGETYPIYLANELKKLGHTVTVLDFELEEYKPEIRNLIDSSVPLVRLKSTDYVYDVIKSLGGDIVHTHHGCVDEIVAKWKNNTDMSCRHIITLHGMYESIDSKDCTNLINEVKRSCDKYIYIADKNLIPFKQRNEFDADKFIKLPNGLPHVAVNRLERKEYGIGEDAFVLCLVSRAMAEKGWYEAIEALELAQKRTSRKLHLLLIGGGELEHELKDTKVPNVHVLGTKKNVRDYFDMSDVGFLPTRFKGESFPLVVIESILCNRPVIVTDIAETRNQLKDENGELAGELLQLKDWKLDVEEIAGKIVKLAEDREYYEKLKARTESAAKKFDLEVIAAQYIKEYKYVYEQKEVTNV